MKNWWIYPPLCTKGASHQTPNLQKFMSLNSWWRIFHLCPYIPSNAKNSYLFRTFIENRNFHLDQRLGASYVPYLCLYRLTVFTLVVSKCNHFPLMSFTMQTCSEFNWYCFADLMTLKLCLMKQQKHPSDAHSRIQYIKYDIWCHQHKMLTQHYLSFLGKNWRIIMYSVANFTITYQVIYIQITIIHDNISSQVC